MNSLIKTALVKAYVFMYTFRMSIALKIKKPTELRETLFETLEQTIRGETVLIQHKAGNSVLQSEAQYLELHDQIETLKAINSGLQDYMDGKSLAHEDVKVRLQKHAKKTKK